ncbi:MAG: alpha/beta hydrolase family protein [Asticcacaulis sp.]
MKSHINRRSLMAAAGAGLATAGLFRFARADDAAKLPPPPTPEMWAKSPQAQHVTLSDDGNRIAYIKEADGKKYIYDFDLTTTKFKVYNIGTAKVGGLSWLDGDHLVLSTFTTDKEDVFAGGRDTVNILTVYNLAKQTTNTLFSRVEHFKTFIAGGVRRVRRDGRTYVTAASHPVNFDDTKVLYRFDLDDADKFELLDRAPWGTTNWVMTPQGDLVARAVYNAKSRAWTLDYWVNGAWKEILRRTSDIERPALYGLARDGKAVIVAMPSDAGSGETYHEISADGVLSAPLNGDGPVRSPIFDPYTFRHCGFSHYDGWPHETWFDPAMQAVQTKAEHAVDGYRMTITDRAEDPNRLIIYTEGDDDAGTYYFLDFTSGKTVKAGEKYPQIPAEWIAAKSAITYTASDGLEIEAYLTLPPNREAKNLPLVMLPHGGPQARDGWELDSEAQTYATLGYAVLQPNYRGSEGYGKAFTDKGHGEIGRKMQTDLSDGVRYLVKQGMVDAKRVCIVGASYGGYAALAGPTLDPGVYNCAVDVAGLSNLKTFLDWTRDFDATSDSPAYRYWTNYFGDPGRYEAASPVKNVANVDVPILIVHGKDDTVVPFSQSTEMVNALKAAGKDVTFIQLESEDHWETNEAARTQMMKTITAFITAHNPPEHV